MSTDGTRSISRREHDRTRERTRVGSRAFDPGSERALVGPELPHLTERPIGRIDHKRRCPRFLAERPGNGSTVVVRIGGLTRTQIGSLVA